MWPFRVVNGIRIVFGVSGSTGFDFCDRGDGEGDSDLALLQQVDLLIVDKTSDHEFGFWVRVWIVLIRG